jgi:hypothetical protein
MDDVSLKEHVESRLMALEKATVLAARTLEKRLEGMNEFRDALKNQAGLFATRSEVQIQVEKLGEDIKILREYKAALEGKASQLYVTMTLIIAIVSTFIAVVSLVLQGTT